MAYSHASLERDKIHERFENRSRDGILDEVVSKGQSGLVDISISFKVNPAHSEKDIENYISRIGWDNDFVVKDIKHDVFIKRDDDVIVQGVKYLLRTRRNEALYDPDFFCNLEDFLFEFVNDVSAQGMKKYIKEAIEKNLSDVIEFKGVDVEPRPDENGYRIVIFVSQIGRSEIVKITDFLEIQ